MVLLEAPRAVGRAVNARIGTFIGLAVLLGMILRSGLHSALEHRGQVRRVTAQQIIFTGWDALPLIGLIALSIGVIVIMQTVRFLPDLGGEAFIGQILVLVIMKELGPILTAFVVIGRSGAAMTIELGYMQVLDEVEALMTLGIDPLRFLLLPRLLGTVISVVVLNVYFNVVATLGGFAVAALGPTRKSFTLLLANFLDAIKITDIGFGLLKAFSFGVIIACVSAYYGLSVRSSITEVPQVTIKAVVGALFLCIAVNLVITVLAI